MATFKELKDKSEKLLNRKAVLNYLVGHVDDMFMGAGSNDKNVLLRTDQMKVPKVAFDDVMTEMLNEIKEIDTELTTISNTPLSPAKN